MYYLIKYLLVAAIAAATISLVTAVGGCGDDETAGTTGTSTAVKTTSTATTKTATTPTETSTTPTSTSTTEAPPPGGPSPSPSAGTVEIIDRSVNPELVLPGQPMTYSTHIRGTATSALINVYNRETGALALTCMLTPGATVGDVTSWSGSAVAPAVNGEYRYFASATGPGGTVEMPGVSGWTFCVGDPAGCP